MLHMCRDTEGYLKMWKKPYVPVVLVFYILTYVLKSAKTQCSNVIIGAVVILFVLLGCNCVSLHFITLQLLVEVLAK